MNGHLLTARFARLFTWLILSTFALAGIGCGSGGKKATVSGKVSYLNKPLTIGTISFYNAAHQIVGSGPIKDGSYKVEGVPVGPMKISVSTPPEIKPDPLHPAPKDMPGNPIGPIVPIPTKYSNPEQSGLTYEVKSGTQDHPIDLK